MERVEYTIDGNRIGISIKYPDEIRRKWSESYTDIECEECGSENISSEKKGDYLVISCNDCENSWQGSVNEVLTWYDTEEAFISLRGLPFQDK